MKTKILFSFLSLFYISSFINAAGFSDSTSCLEISGRVVNLKVNKQNNYKVELIYNGVVIDSILMNTKRDFKFSLSKNTIYGIRISKEGYLPRIISVDTSLPQYANGYFRFQFDVELIKNEEVKKMNVDALDFPIAIVAFNQNINNFYYNEEYTTYIKRRIYLSTEF
jgi:hypothetical protein